LPRGLDSRYSTGTRISRPQSPVVENSFEDAFAETIKELCETKGLYQNASVNTQFLAELADNNWSVEALKREFSRRPIQPVTRREHITLGERGFAGTVGGVEAIGTPIDEIRLTFYLPIVEIACANCKQSCAHTSVPPPPLPHESPFPNDENGTVQVLHVIYACTSCHEHVIAFQVLRRGLRLQLTGRTSPFRPKLDECWPKKVRDVIADAFVAVAEGDLPAGFYHLRTAQEIFMKDVCGVPIGEKIEGQDLCERYNKATDQRVIRDFPSMSVLYSTLSECLHTRKEDHQLFEKSIADFMRHLKARRLFEEIS
jgi:hypothetical protein